MYATEQYLCLHFLNTEHLNLFLLFLRLIFTKRNVTCTLVFLGMDVMLVTLRMKNIVDKIFRKFKFSSYTKYKTGMGEIYIFFSFALQLGKF